MDRQRVRVVGESESMSKQEKKQLGVVDEKQESVSSESQSPISSVSETGLDELDEWSQVLLVLVYNVQTILPSSYIYDKILQPPSYGKISLPLSIYGKISLSSST